MDIQSCFALLTSAATSLIFGLTHSRLKTSFFLYLLAASLSLACGSSATCLNAEPAEAVTDMSVAIAGGFLIAAAISLNTSFKIADGHND
jgi:hypothetical protein